METNVAIVFVWGGGGGKTGKRFLESESWKNLKEKYSGIVFYDNNHTLPESIEGVERVKTLDDQKDILITSSCFLEIYYECVVSGRRVIGIFDAEDDCIYDYRLLCKKKRSGYDNEAKF